MQKLVGWLAGKKTFILAGIAIAAELVNFISAGNFSFLAWTAFIQNEAVAAAFATLRLSLFKKG